MTRSNAQNFEVRPSLRYQPSASRAVPLLLLMLTHQVGAQDTVDMSTVPGELHSVSAPTTPSPTSGFMGLVFEEETREFLVPTYRSLPGHLFDAERAISEAGGMPESTDLSAPRNFRPYPIYQTSIYTSRVVAILDSGVLTEHPLLQGRLRGVVDFTSEGIEDTCGHGTVQALRHALFEPRAQLLILKVAGRSCRPTLGTILSALEYLKSRRDVGGVYFAGGINRDDYEVAQIACDFANELVRENGLSMRFFATTGNTDRSARWCPAAAEEVIGLQVIDLETYAKPAGASGGFAVLQKGENTSFPDMEAMRISEFYAHYTRLFLYDLPPESLPFMERFARKAYQYEDSFEDAVRLLAKISFQEGNRDRAASMLEDALRRRPNSAILAAELAVVYARMDRGRDADPLFARAFSLLATETGGEDDRFPASLFFEHGLYLEAVVEDSMRATEQIVRAAELDPERLGALNAYGGRRYYQDAFDDAITVNRHILRLDPTFGVAWHNIGISHALAGRTRDALGALGTAEEMLGTFNSGTDVPNFVELRNIIANGSEIERQVGLRYLFADNRKHASELVRIRRLVALPTQEAKSALGRSGVRELEALAQGALTWTEQLLEVEPSDFLITAAVFMGKVHEALERSGTLELRGAVTRQVARLYRRLQNHDGAALWFRREAELLRTVSVRERERALLHAALCALAGGRSNQAATLMDEAMQTSFKIAEEPEFREVGPYVTAMVSELMAGQAWVAMMKGDLHEAESLAYSGYMKNRESFFNLLTMAAVRIRTDREMDADHALAAVLTQVRNSGAELASLYRMFLDHPFLDVEYKNGETTLSALRTAERALEARAVELVPAVEFSLRRIVDYQTGRWQYPLGRCWEGEPGRGAPVTAMLGTGLTTKHPCLARRIVDSVDLTGRGFEDENGATTGQAMGLVAADGGFGALRNIRVLDDFGYGSVEGLIKGFAEIVVSEPAMAMTHLQTDFVDDHLTGLVWRASLKTVIITNAPLEDSGRVFPYSVAGRVIIVSD